MRRRRGRHRAFDAAAEPVILNVMEHMFKDAADTSDLVYYTRRSLVRRHYQAIRDFLVRLGDTGDLAALAPRETPDTSGTAEVGGGAGAP